MHIDLITCQPRAFSAMLDHFIVKRGQAKGVLKVQVHNLRDYTPYKGGKIDDAPYGGEAGMVLMIEPIVNCIRALQQQRSYQEVIYLTPDGMRLTQPLLNRLTLHANLILLCGHYKGIDERVRTHFVTQEISIGDYVLSGGELPAMVLLDGLARLIPGVLGDPTSALTDSFQDDQVAPPVYTRPAHYEGLEVPKVLLSGNHAAIAAWRAEMAFQRTRAKLQLLPSQEGY